MHGKKSSAQMIDEMVDDLVSGNDTVFAEDDVFEAIEREQNFKKAVDKRFDETSENLHDHFRPFLFGLPIEAWCLFATIILCFIGVGLWAYQISYWFVALVLALLPTSVLTYVSIQSLFRKRDL